MKSISASRLKINGTAAQRAAMDTKNLNPKDSFLESDTGLRYIWDGDSWEQRVFGGGVTPGGPLLETTTGDPLLETTTGDGLTET